DGAAARRSSGGPPAGFAEHSPPPVLGMQRTLMTSLSFLGFALATATAVSVTVGDGRTLPFLFTFSGSRRMLSAEQVAPVMGVSGGTGGVVGERKEAGLILLRVALCLCFSLGFRAPSSTLACAAASPSPSLRAP